VPDVNVPAVALAALIIAIVAAVGVGALGIWALDASPKTIRHRHKRRTFTCPCGHDFVYHQRIGPRTCNARPDFGVTCGCQGYGGELPPATLAELLDGPS
jgi:hypothetical protein